MDDVILLPGMGADARMYVPLLGAIAGRMAPPSPPGWPRACPVRVADFIPPRDGETLRAYAVRMAASIPIPAGSVIGGSSLGGMVALEIARVAPVAGVLLIGSCRSPTAIPVRHLARLSPFVPDAALIDSRAVQALGLAMFGLRDADHRRLLAAMTRRAGARFIRWACHAAAHWDGGGGVTVPVRAIHGARDRLIPTTGVAADRVVSGAGHLLALTHPRAVADFIAEGIA